MKISTFLATGLGVFLFAGAASAAQTSYVARLTGPFAGVPNTTAEADATVTLNDDVPTAPKLDVAIVYKGFTAKATTAHAHTGACDEEGTVFHSFERDDMTTATDAEGTFTAAAPFDITEEQAAAIKAGDAFLTVSSEGAFDYVANGDSPYEIRGQIVAEGATTTCILATPDAGTTPTPTPDAGTTTPDTTPDTTTTVDDGGCNTSGTGSTGSSGLVALGLGLAVYGLARKRTKKA